jgi:hypothetical protein
MRIRSIKPEFVKSEQIAELTYRQRLLFIGLWMMADKNGCLKCAPRRIKAELFPFDDITTEDVITDLQRTSEVLLTYLYSSSEEGKTEECKTVEEAEFISIPNFVKHQRLTVWEKKDSHTDIPLPKHFRSTLEALSPEERRGEERISEERRGMNDTSPQLPNSLRSRIESCLTQFRAVHTECEKVSEMQFVAALRATGSLEADPSIITEALDAFERQCCSVTSFRPQTPVGKFENYLRHALDEFQKKNGAGGTDAPVKKKSRPKID